MSIVTWAEKEAIENIGVPMVIEKIEAMAQTESGRKVQTVGVVQLLYGFCGIFLGVMPKATAASYMQSGFQGLLFSEKVMAEIEAEREKILKERPR